MLNLLLLFREFAQFSLLCFGGGYMLIPLLIKEFVEKQQVLTLAEFGNLLAIAQTTPGPVGINSATYVGYLAGGVPGAAAATAGMVVPTMILGCLAVTGMRRWKDAALLRAMLAGARVAALALVWFSVTLFLGLSVFTAPIPWAEWLHLRWPEGFAVSPGGLLICLASMAAIRWTKCPMLVLIVLAAIAGALFCR